MASRDNRVPKGDVNTILSGWETEAQDTTPADLTNTILSDWDTPEPGPTTPTDVIEALNKPARQPHRRKPNTQKSKPTRDKSQSDDDTKKTAKKTRKPKVTTSGRSKGKSSEATSKTSPHNNEESIPVIDDPLAETYDDARQGSSASTAPMDGSPIIPEETNLASQEESSSYDMSYDDSFMSYEDPHDDDEKSSVWGKPLTPQHDEDSDADDLIDSDQSVISETPSWGYGDASSEHEDADGNEILDPALLDDAGDITEEPSDALTTDENAPTPNQDEDPQSNAAPAPMDFSDRLAQLMGPLGGGASVDTSTITSGDSTGHDSLVGNDDDDTSPWNASGDVQASLISDRDMGLRPSRSPWGGGRTPSNTSTNTIPSISNGDDDHSAWGSSNESEEFSSNIGEGRPNPSWGLDDKIRHTTDNKDALEDLFDSYEQDLSEIEEMRRRTAAEASSDGSIRNHNTSDNPSIPMPIPTPQPQNEIPTQFNQSWSGTSLNDAPSYDRNVIPSSGSFPGHSSNDDPQFQVDDKPASNGDLYDPVGYRDEYDYDPMSDFDSFQAPVNNDLNGASALDGDGGYEPSPTGFSEGVPMSYDDDAEWQGNQAQHDHSDFGGYEGTGDQHETSNGEAASVMSESDDFSGSDDDPFGNVNDDDTMIPLDTGVLDSIDENDSFDLGRDLNDDDEESINDDSDALGEETNPRTSKSLGGGKRKSLKASRRHEEDPNGNTSHDDEPSENGGSKDDNREKSTNLLKGKGSFKEKLQALLVQIKSELHGGSDSDAKSSDSSKTDGSNVADEEPRSLSKEGSKDKSEKTPKERKPRKSPKETLDSIVQSLKNPKKLISDVSSTVRQAKKTTWIIITVCVLIGGVWGGSNIPAITNKGKVAEAAADEGTVSLVSTSWSDGKAKITMKNNSEMIAHVAGTAEVRSWSPSLNPMTWLTARVTATCTIPSVEVDPGVKKTVDAKCTAPSGTWHRVRASLIYQ